MDGGGQWSSRLSSSPSSLRNHQLQSEAYLGEGDDVEVEEDHKQEYSCPFCADEFDIVGLFCHMEEQHQVELKNGICPVCAKRVGTDMVGHITMQHGSFLKIQRKKRFRRGAPYSMFSLLRKELREGNRELPFGGSLTFSSNNTDPNPDPLLSSFIYSSSSVEELGKGESHTFKDLVSLPELAEKENGSCQQKYVLSEKEHEEEARKCEYAKVLTLSTLLDDIL